MTPPQRPKNFVPDQQPKTLPTEHELHDGLSQGFPYTDSEIDEIKRCIGPVPNIEIALFDIAMRAAGYTMVRRMPPLPTKSQQMESFQILAADLENLAHRLESGPAKFVLFSPDSNYRDCDSFVARLSAMSAKAKDYAAKVGARKMRGNRTPASHQLFDSMIWVWRGLGRDVRTDSATIAFIRACSRPVIGHTLATHDAIRMFVRSWLRQVVDSGAKQPPKQPST